MATNRELRATAEALAEEVGVSVSTDGLGRKKIEELIESLEARKVAPPEPEVEAETPTDPPADAPHEAVVPAESASVAAHEPPPAPPPPAQSTGPARYVVAHRVSFCCGPRGLLRPGDQVRLDDFDTAERFYEQVAAGKIRKV